MLLANSASASGDISTSLVAVVVVGIAVQWLAHRVRLPSIILLLASGVLVGPEAIDLVDPDELLGDLLFPAVSLAVGVLLFEGGLNMRFRDLGRHGAHPVLRLVTIGAVVTWAVGGVTAAVVVGLDTGEATLLGAILVVSGPTVMLPLLRHARVRQPVSDILRWEGIVIDPIGAAVAVAVLRGVLVRDSGPVEAAREIAMTAGVGLLAGIVGAVLLTLTFARHWVPDELHNPVTLAVLLAVFAAANVAQPESGLFAATAMGVALANQRFTTIGHIREFEENLGTLILSSLFVVLGASIFLDDLVAWAPEAGVLLAALVLVARPLAVWASTVGSGLTRRERIYLVFMAPRGIVAASVATVFGLELQAAGRSSAGLVPLTIMIIVGTVVIYGLVAKPAARWLHLAQPEPRGVVLIGGPPWALELGKALAQQDVPVLVVTRDREEAEEAAARGLLTYTRRPDAEELQLAFDSVGARLAIATSRTQELNAYGLGRAIGALGRANVYYLPRHEAHGHGEADAVSRRPFARGLTQATIGEALVRGGQIVTMTDGDHNPVPFRAKDLPEGTVTLVRVTAEGIPMLGNGRRRPADPPAGGSSIYLLPPAEELVAVP